MAQQIEVHAAIHLDGLSGHVGVGDDHEHGLRHFLRKAEAAERDFGGWIQERGLYFLEQWDERFTPLLESHDPGEPPQRGGMVIATYGKGQFVYTGYAWFRQLPAGVPGAFRLFANLISLPRAP